MHPDPIARCTRSRLPEAPDVPAACCLPILVARAIPASCAPTTAALHPAFLCLLPRIELHARITFRNVRCPDRREDAVAEVVGLVWAWYARLTRRGKDPSRFPTALATFAARAVRSGRRVCGQERAKDVLSPLAQARHGFVVASLPGCSTLGGSPFDEALRDNTRSPVPEQVCFRADFPAWLRTLGRRDRRLAQAMALGHRTGELARRFRVSPARISQLRREFHDGWTKFCGEDS